MSGKQLFSIVAASTLLAACGNGDEQGVDCELRLGLVTDQGQIDDGSFNTSAWTGVQNAAGALGLDTEACTNYRETILPEGQQEPTEADWAPNVQDILDWGADIVVMNGFNLVDYTQKVAAENPDVKFIGVDQQPDNVEDNAVGLVFNEDRAGFLAGALAAHWAIENDDNRIGPVGGVYASPFPIIVQFATGFYLGVRQVQEQENIQQDIDVLTEFYDSDNNEPFGDPEWGRSTAEAMINNHDPEVIFHAAGGTGVGALRAGCEAGIEVIGVDVDQYVTIPDVQDCILSSATKNIVNGVSDLLQAASEGEFPGGTLYSGAVGLAPFHNFDEDIPQNVKDSLQDIDAKLKAGDLESCTSEGIDDPELKDLSNDVCQ